MSEPSMEIVPSMDYGDPKNRIHPINKVLQQSKSKNMTVLEILAKDSGCKINKKYSFIEDVAGRTILLLNYSNHMAYLTAMYAVPYAQMFLIGIPL
ncbi:MAG: hypothetical protein IIA82_07310 [Thaumarchaeota archaeon]|nr:hypothetical protein [Nitrososphaerota archaeon]